jgi:hypothetical protein
MEQCAGFRKELPKIKPLEAAIKKGHGASIFRPLLNLYFLSNRLQTEHPMPYVK